MNRDEYVKSRETELFGEYHMDFHKDFLHVLKPREVLVLQTLINHITSIKYKKGQEDDGDTLFRCAYKNINKILPIGIEEIKDSIEVLKEKRYLFIEEKKDTTILLRVLKDNLITDIAEVL